MARNLIRRIRNLPLALSLACFFICMVTLVPSFSQELSKRLILKDGSYQLATKWEVQGNRVRYFSAERSSWEEVPNDLVDWDATNKFEKDRAAGLPAPEAVALDKELAEERAADEAKTPQVAPGLHLPDDGTMLLLDTFQNQPQLVELQQSGGEIDRNTKANILRAAINPIASAKQSIELEGTHARIQSHTAMPSIYVNLAQNEQPSAGPEQPQQPEKPQQPMMDWDRFHIVHAETKKGNRVIGGIKINPLGKTSQQQNLVSSTSAKLTGGWVKVTPDKPLEPGEYAVVEMMGRQGINLYVWDFGVNPAAPANGLVINPDASTPPADSSKPAALQPKR